MEDTNRSEDIVKVVWEVLPDEGEFIFRELNSEDIDSAFFCPDQLVAVENFPVIPHPVFDMANDCLDRVWTQSTIKINTEYIADGLPDDPEEIKIVDIHENHKGLICPFTDTLCQEGWCMGCNIYLNQSI